MKVSIFASLLLSFSTLVHSAPVPEVEASPVVKEEAMRVRALMPRDSGHYTVSGLGARKKAIVAAGGNVLDIAIAMLETDNMQTNYKYGDGKTQDSANFGVFKQNWGMMRTCGSRYGFKGQSQAQWNNGASINSNLYADVATRWDCQNYYGIDKWFGGHRNGASGISNPYTQDIQNYKTAVYWIQSQLQSNSKYMTDDTRFWMYVVPI